MREPIYNGSVQKLDKPESLRPSERIEFENGSVIECLKTNKETIRGNRSKHLDIPEWIIAEILSKYDK